MSKFRGKKNLPVVVGGQLTFVSQDNTRIFSATDLHRTL